MADVKDDTPAEVSFFWRRTLTISAVVVNSVMIAIIIFRIETPRELMWIALALTATNVVFALMYMAGASAVDLGTMGAGFSWMRPAPKLSRIPYPTDFGDGYEDREQLAEDGKPI